MVLTDYRQSLQLWMRSFLVNKVKAETNYIAGYGVQRNDIKELITNSWTDYFLPLICC